MNPFTQTFVQTAGALLGILLPVLGGFLIFRFVLAVINVWEESAKYARLREQERIDSHGIIRVEDVQPAPNPKFMYVLFSLSTGRVLKRAVELPDNLRWSRP